MLKAERVHKRFGRLEVLRGISLEVERGEVMCVIGPSGSGKSTFLRCDQPPREDRRGRLWVDGELVGYASSGERLYELRDSEIARKRGEIGMVFQRFNLFPHKTALENVIEAPCQVRSVPRREAVAQATAAARARRSRRQARRLPRRSSPAASSSASRSRARLR